VTGRLPALLLLIPALLPAREEPAAGAARSKLSIGEVLEPNSVLSGVMIPRYDEQLRLTSLLRAKAVTLVSADVFDGDEVEIRLYQADRSSRGTLELSRARYDQAAGKVRGTGPTRLTLDRMLTTASGLTLDVGPSEGFFHGPVNTRVSPPPPATAMNSRLLPLPAAVLIGTAVAAEPPPPAADTPPSATGLRAVLESSAKVTEAAAAYLEKEGRPAPRSELPVQGPKEGNKRVLVYLGNVRAKDPRFTMKGANKLEAFFAAKPKKDDQKEPSDSSGSADSPGRGKPAGGSAAAGPAKDPLKEALPSDLAAEVGDLERIVATGAVVFKQQVKEGEVPIEASGAILTFEAKTETVTLSGGFPWVRKGGMVQQSMKAEQTITIVNNVATFSPGGTRSIIPTGEMQREQDRNREAEKADKNQPKR